MRRPTRSTTTTPAALFPFLPLPRPNARLLLPIPPPKRKPPVPPKPTSGPSSKVVEVQISTRPTLEPRKLRSQREFLFICFLAEFSSHSFFLVKSKVSPSLPLRLPTSEDDANGDTDLEIVDVKPPASSVSSLFAPGLPRITRGTKRRRMQSPEVFYEEPTVPRGPSVDEHSLRGPSHPDVISLDDVPVIPSLNESTVRYFFPYISYFSLTCFLLARSLLLCLQQRFKQERSFTCKLVKWGVGCSTASTVVKRAAPNAQSNDAFLDSVSRVAGFSAAHPESISFISLFYICLFLHFLSRSSRRDESHSSEFL